MSRKKGIEDHDENLPEEITVKTVVAELKRILSEYPRDYLPAIIQPGTDLYFRCINWASGIALWLQTLLQKENTVLDSLRNTISSFCSQITKLLTPDLPVRTDPIITREMLAIPLSKNAMETIKKNLAAIIRLLEPYVI